VKILARSELFRQLRRFVFVSMMAAFAGVSRPAQGALGAPCSGSSDGSNAADASRPGGLAFEVTCAAGLLPGRVTGRVYVFLGPDRLGLEPRFGPKWFHPQPFFAMNVASWNSEEPLRIDSRADGFPGALHELPAGRYAVQCVVRLDPDTRRIGDGEGNAYGPVVHAHLDPKNGATVALKVNHKVEPRSFTSSERLKLVELESARLSAFFRRPIKHRAAVILPRGIAQEGESATRPVLYIIPGFGGDHTEFRRFLDTPRRDFGADFIRVVLDPDCGTGHHVFADSAANGPRGTALVEELIPYIERTFPAIADPRARLLCGHSSGGWSSLWLQVSHPDFFGGTWSTSPDPVDFRDFQRINIYAPGENMFRDGAGARRPIARFGTMPVLYYDRFSRMDDVIGWGGQLGSFEAVFSPLDRDGRPRKLWDRTTGAIDPEVAKAWEAYDIRLVLERNWAALGPRLKGKIHVFTGAMDTFYLEGATTLLAESLARLGSDAVVEVIPGRDHGSLLDDALAERLDREMKAAAGGVTRIRPPGAD
jgi:S-formylglutathione hydrolase FrmB